MRTKVLFVLMICLLFAGCAAKVTPLATPRVEAAELSFQLPEGWAYEAALVSPDDEAETIVILYPPDAEKLPFWYDQIVMANISLYNERIPAWQLNDDATAQISRFHNFYEEGMDVDMWLEAMIAGLERTWGGAENYVIEEVAVDTREVRTSSPIEGNPDAFFYLRVVDGIAVRLSDSRRVDITEDDMALFEQIIQSVEIVP